MSDDGTGSPRAEDATVALAPAPAERYLDGVRSALADLPAPEVAEILDDVRAHLAELVLELGDDASSAALTDRLGPPAEYAAELRAAAGYPSGPQQPAAPPSFGRARLALAGGVVAALVTGLSLLASSLAGIFIGLLLLAACVLPLVLRGGAPGAGLAALPEVRWFARRPAEGTPARVVVDFLVSMQPAWWVARAFAAATVLVVLFGGGGFTLTLLVALLGMPVSVWLGHRTRSDRRWLWPVVPLNGLAVLVLLVAAVEGPFADPVLDSDSSTVPYDGLWQGSEEIRDIRPVDATGTPLTDVYLFDQDGRPIDTSADRWCPRYDAYGDPAPADGAVAPYPRGTWDVDGRTGGCRHVPPVPLVVAVPAPTAGATATQSPVTTAPVPPASTGPLPPAAPGAEPPR
jgi:uncharacterized membrane protein